MTVNLIAAVGRRGQLGLGGILPWRDLEDLAFFKQLTLGHVVVFGRKTFDDVGELSGRLTIRVTKRDALAYHDSGAYSVPREPREMIGYLDERIIFVAGGETVYREWMPFVRRAYITLIDYDGPADVFMPPLWQIGEK